MTFWPWWLGGVGLATVMVAHWLLTRRMMAVSGRMTALVDRVRFGPSEDTTADMSDAELEAALLAATLEAFGDLPPLPDAPPPVPAPSPPRVAPLERPRRPQGPGVHLLFFGGLLLGGLASSLLAGTFSPAFALAGQGYSRAFAGSPVGALGGLFVGGLLVGAGTRMAGGCTSGHGLCGTSRLQSGSLASTASFFGAGVAASFLLGSVL